MVRFKVMNKYSQAQLNPSAYAHVENYVPPPAQFADKPPKKRIKFVKKKKSPAKEPEPQKKKIKFKVKPKPKQTELEKFTGLKKEKANELDPLSLFGMLPQELRKNILTPSNTGVTVGNEMPTFNELSRMNTENLVKAYIDIKSDIKFSLRYKQTIFSGYLSNILKRIGRKFGTLPSTRGINDEVDIFDILKNRFGPQYDKAVKEELLKRLAPKNKVSEKIYFDRLKPALKEQADRKEFDEFIKIRDKALEKVDKKLDIEREKYPEHAYHINAYENGRGQFMLDSNRFYEEIIATYSPKVQEQFNKYRWTWKYDLL